VHKIKKHTTCQAVEKRDPLSRLWRDASSFVIAAYGLYASFLRIRAPCISSFWNSLSEMLFSNSLICLAAAAGNC